MRYSFEDFVFDTARRELWRGAEAVAVEPQIFDLLACLIENRERVVSKDDLLAIVWKGRIVSESTLGSSINAARVAVGDSGEAQRLVRTLSRKGFRFVGAVREEPDPAEGTAAAIAEAPAEAARSAVATEPSTAGPVARLPARRLTPAMLTVLVLVTGAAVAIAAFLANRPWPASNAPATALSGRRFDASSVPLIPNEMRRGLATYPNRPDVKALAITAGEIGLSDGQPNAEAARRDALDRCFERTRRRCRIYAIGMDVVLPKEAIPLASPGDLRFEPTDIPLVPDDIPLINRSRRNTIAHQHMNAPDHKALSLAGGVAWTIAGKATRAEASRLALEDCGEYRQRPCLLLAVDGMLTVQIPKSRPISRIFLPSTEDDIPGDQRARIAAIYRGAEWRAVARGKAGTWHAVAAAPSEAAAVEAALKACGEADSACQVYAIGNFRVAEN